MHAKALKYASVILVAFVLLLLEAVRNYWVGR